MKREKRLLVTVLAMLVMLGMVFGGSEMSGNLKLIGSTAPEAKIEAGYTVKMPFLQGEGALFSGNNVKLKGLMGISPISASLSLDAVITPIAVMELSTGGTVGTGWNFDAMSLMGLAIGDGTSAVTHDSLGGIYYKARGGAALQFDTAAIWPGDWTSVVVRTYHEINYQGYSGVAADEGWEFETAGLHKNSLNYKGDYLVGYQMPIMVNMVAIMFETYVDNMETDIEVGMTFDLGLVANFQFTERLSLTVIPQISNREIAKDTRKMGVRDIGFKRVAAMLNYTL